MVVLIINATSDLKPPTFCGHFNSEKGVASQDTFDCTVTGVMVKNMLNKENKKQRLHVINMFLKLVMMLDYMRLPFVCISLQSVWTHLVPVFHHVRLVSYTVLPRI